MPLYRFEFEEMRLIRSYALAPGEADDRTPPMNGVEGPVGDGGQLYQHVRSSGGDVLVEALERNGRLTGYEGRPSGGNKRTIANATVSKTGFEAFELQVVAVDLEQLRKMAKGAVENDTRPKPRPDVPLVNRSLGSIPPGKQRTLERVEVSFETPGGRVVSRGGRSVGPDVYGEPVTVAIMFTPNAGVYTVTGEYWR
ncbi:MAG: hypothetical protein R3324_22185, partial [Halobacteriales archaeon]|nr:hypothetical protein [Halobacteriales archaeon]